MMQPGVVVATWKATLEAVERVGRYTTLEAARSAGIRHSKKRGLTVEGPASACDIRRIETDLGMGLPPAVSRFFWNARGAWIFAGSCPATFSPLGCPGPEDWQWLPFTSKGTTMLDPDGEAARAWRETVGLELPT